MAGRFHEHRRSRLSGPLRRHRHAGGAPRVLVSADAVPYRPNRGVYVVVREGADGPGLDPRTRRAWLASMLGRTGWPACGRFATDDRFDSHVWRPGDKTITVCLPRCRASLAGGDPRRSRARRRGGEPTPCPVRRSPGDDHAVALGLVRRRADRRRDVRARQQLDDHLAGVPPGEQEIESVGGALEARRRGARRASPCLRPATPPCRSAPRGTDRGSRGRGSPPSVPA